MGSIKQETLTGVLHAGNLRVDREAYCAQVDGRCLHLTSQEFELLGILMAGRGKIMPQPALALALWGAADRAELRRLAALTGRLRAKLGQFEGYRLETVRGRGYGLLEVDSVAA